MTLLEHFKLMGYSPEDASEIIGNTEYDCEEVEVNKFRCRPTEYGGIKDAVILYARERFSDGYMHTRYFGGCQMTAYF